MLKLPFTRSTSVRQTKLSDTMATATIRHSTIHPARHKPSYNSDNVFTRLAQQGDAVAQFNLAMMHTRGEGVARDPAAALRWFEESASQGNIHAQRQLSKMYFYGLTVPRSLTTATYWTRKAADQGDPDSELLLPQLYAQTAQDHSPEDFDSAVEWMFSAAEQQNLTAQYTLAGWFYTGVENGRLSRDPKRAFELWRDAAERGHVESRCRAGEMMLLGDDIVQDTSTGLEWLRMASEGNLKNAEVQAYVKYVREDLLRRGLEAKEQEKYKRARLWLDAASELGSVEAMVAIGDLYYENEETDEKTFMFAADYYRRAGSLGNAYALRRLGTMYLKGEGVSEDVVIAYDYYKQASILNDHVAKSAFQPPQITATDSIFRSLPTLVDLQPSPSTSTSSSTSRSGPSISSKMWHKLAKKSSKGKVPNTMTTNEALTPAEMFERGCAARRDGRFLKALVWFKDAAQSEGNPHVEAMMILGIMHGLGQGVEEDKHEAAMWLTQAARHGHVAAKVFLGSMYNNEGENEIGYILLRQCVDQGNGEAAYILGINHWHGNGVREDASEAARWLRIAVQLGYEKANDDLWDVEAFLKGIKSG